MHLLNYVSATVAGPLEASAREAGKPHNSHHRDDLRRSRWATFSRPVQETARAGPAAVAGRVPAPRTSAESAEVVTESATRRSAA